MSPPPRVPKAYHITHVDNLNSIVADGGLSSDADMVIRGGPKVGIGMTRIKEARLAKPMPCYPSEKVGEYVPFNFCPRSVMLFVIHCGNNPGLAFRDGQRSVVHLQFDLGQVLDWADSSKTRWAFTSGNARASYTAFHTSRHELDRVDWDAVANNDFRDAFVQDAKQAELLVHHYVPWKLVESVGVRSAAVAADAMAAMADCGHEPPVVVERSWYF